ncbi:MmyB family transcriptional regulator [Amycolatopsis alkalitolerans]|uniref:MmyB family transcriptional regulator n=1 Tax=Amycolatopsis alkalitolerans TaxID=2547244 RepID=UPI001357FDC6
MGRWTPSWPSTGEAARAVASLRLVAGRHPDDRQLAQLIGELVLRSPEFAALWARHPVTNGVSGIKHFRPREVGAHSLQFEALALPDQPGLRMLLYSAAPGSPAEAALLLLSQMDVRAGELRRRVEAQ